jgi:endonuclease YncB( thermonuclease family)
MKKLLLALAALVALVTVPTTAKNPEGVVYDVVITRVIDGDTVGFRADWLPKPLKPELSIRVYGVDTPEKGFRAKCPEEDQRGKLATKFTTNLVAKSTQRQVILYDWDKYGGRVLGDVILDGQSLRAALIANGFAREYYGEAKQSWCP